MEYEHTPPTTTETQKFELTRDDIKKIGLDIAQHVAKVEKLNTKNPKMYMKLD